MTEAIEMKTSEELKGFINGRERHRNRPHRFGRSTRRAYDIAEKFILPSRDRGKDDVDGKYADEYSCCPPPVFIPLSAIVMIVVYAIHTKELVEKYGHIGINGPAPTDSVLIYNPYKRHEAWRYLTYMFVHSGWMHICSNILMQLILGIPLEMVHRFWRVAIVYCGGVIAGSLLTSLTDPYVFLAGASGGVYALILAHLATVIMNWEEMEFPWFRLLFFTVYAATDVGVALYGRYFGTFDEKIGYAAHFGGSVAGLLMGIYVLRNLCPLSWERKLAFIAFIFSFFFFLAMILINLLYHEHFPPLRMTPYVQKNL